jgi:SAM-dependent methyltransferase
MLGRIAKYRDRLAQYFAFESRPDLPFLRSALRPALHDRLAAEDSADRKAVIIGDSVGLARLVGLRKAQLLILPYPDFTLENLALLGDEYDFVIADRMLHRCDSLEDAARETMRVLRPNGWFVHTTSILDLDTEARADWRRYRPAALEKLFPAISSSTAGGWGGVMSWVVGRKASPAPQLVPTVATRKSRRRWYRYKPRAATFGVVAAARNEAPYLLEWIAHYRVLGFEQITIYDNQSNDASARILAPLARAGIINAMYWTDRAAKQRRAYSNAIRKLRPFVEWCLFADPRRVPGSRSRRVAARSAAAGSECVRRCHSMAHVRLGGEAQSFAGARHRALHQCGARQQSPGEVAGAPARRGQDGAPHSEDLHRPDRRCRRQRRRRGDPRAASRASQWSGAHQPLFQSVVGRIHLQARPRPRRRPWRLPCGRVVRQGGAGRG